MKVTINPPKGMKDILPYEKSIKEFCIKEIKKVYTQYGYNMIETPIMENICNLLSKHGGENEKLIFKILKRGNKLNFEDNSSLSDYGLRYDLTMPLIRFFVNNKNELNFPFKSLQIGPVFRADKPQRGRFRQFTQCDIDIIGENNSIFAEVDLLVPTIQLLSKFGFKNIKVKINNRKFLEVILKKCGVEEALFNNIFIILDKIDKIGFENIKELLSEVINDSNKIDNLLYYLKCFSNIRDIYDLNFEKIENICKDFKYELLEYKNIFKYVNLYLKKLNIKDVSLVFDITLVRGMNYYTSNIFEITVDEFNLSVSGGGRYNKLAEFFENISIPACGISIGLDRIVLLLMEKGFILKDKKKVCVLVNKDVDFNEDIIKKVCKLKESYDIVSLIKSVKNVKKQIEDFKKLGYSKLIYFTLSGIKEKDI